MLGRRDPAAYGQSSLSDLETQVYEWARELDRAGALPPDEPRGRVRRVVIHEALGRRRRPDRSTRAPGRTTRWAIRDALEPFDGPVVEVHLSNVDEREEWRRHSVLAGLVGTRDRRQGPRRLPGGARALARAAASMSRLERLALGSERAAARHERASTSLPDGLDSSNAALARRAGRRRPALHRLPLREAARRSSTASTFAQTKREPASSDARRAAHRPPVGFEAATLTVRAVGDAARRRRRARADAGLVEALRAVKDEGELDAIRRAAASPTSASRRSPRSGSSGGRSGSSPGGSSARFHELGADELAFDVDRRAGVERRQPARRARRRRRSWPGRSSPSTRAASSTATAPTARERSPTGELPDELARPYAGRASRPSSPALAAVARRASRHGTSTPPRAT